MFFGGVEGGEEITHFDGCGVEGTPHAAHVVDDVEAELDCGGTTPTLMGVAEADFDEAATDPDNCCRGPGRLRVAGFPEEGKKPLRRGIEVSRWWMVCRQWTVY